MPAKHELSPKAMETLDAIWKLEKIILNSLDFRRVVQEVVDSILLELGYLELGYKIVVLALVDKNTNTLKRVALSQTEEAWKTREVSKVPFDQITIPMEAGQNSCIKAIIENRPQITHYFPDILTPPLTPENALESQKNAGIKTSMVYPLNVRGKTIGIMIFSMTKGEEEVTAEEKRLIQYFADLSALAVQNSKLYSDLELESQKLADANETLKILDKQKDEFLSVASHELRTPMTIIKSYLWMLSSGHGGKLVEKQKEYVEKAKRGTERMLALIGDMLNISRIEQGRLDFNIEKLNLREAFEDILGDFKIKMDEKKLKLEIIVQKDAELVYSDKDKLTEILINLVGNSFKFTDKGSITVKAEKENENFVKVSIIDTGRGIAKEDMQRLFHKFSRLDNSYQTVAETGGTGLGLFIVKQFVETMGGTVGAYSEGIDKGSTFWLTLPTNPPEK